MRTYFEDDDGDFEDWEGDYQLYENEDWKGLLELREARLKKNPDEYYTQERYAEALLLNQKYREAIAYLTPLDKKYPDNCDITHKILESLYTLGRTEQDFNWAIPPLIWTLDNALIDKCYTILKKNKHEMDSHDIMNHLFLLETAYLSFTPDELTTALKKDGRFHQNEDHWINIKPNKKSNE